MFILSSNSKIGQIKLNEEAILSNFKKLTKQEEYYEAKLSKKDLIGFIKEKLGIEERFSVFLT